MSVKVFKNNSDLDYSLALKKIEEQDYLFALKLLKEAVKGDKKPEHYVELAELYYKLGQYEESTATYIELANRVITMEIAFAVLRSNQASLGTALNPDELTIPINDYFKLSRKLIDNPHLNKIIKRYQEIALKIDKPKLIDLKAKKIDRLLEEARISAIRGDSSRAMIILDGITDSAYQDKIDEIRTIVYFTAEDYDKVIETGYKLNERVKGNISLIRSILYSIFARDGKRITPEFRNAFNDFEEEISNFSGAIEYMGLYEFAQMVGYVAGVKRLIKKLENKYPYDISVILAEIAYYALEEDFQKVDKLLKRANAVHSHNPHVNYFNCLRKESETSELLSDAWLCVSDIEMCAPYVNLLVLNYLKKLMEGSSESDVDVLKTAMVYLDKDRLKSVLSITRITEFDDYKDLLIWGIESPYLGIENKIVLMELYISKYPDTERLFTIPSEIGVHCMRLRGVKGKELTSSEKSIYNGVYPNVVLTEREIDRAVLLKVIKSMHPQGEPQEENLLRATAHLLYFSAKKYELQWELVAGTYQVSLEELKRCFALYSEN